MTQPADPRHEAAVAAWNALKSERAHDEQDWEEIARLIRNQRGGFVAADPARRRDDKPLSSAPMVAQVNFSAGLYGTLTNPTERWFRLGVLDEDLAGWQPMRQWLELATDRVHASFAASPFYEQAMPLYGDMTSFGNAAQYDDVPPGERQVLDVTLSLAEIVADIDGYGRVTEVARKFRMSPVAAARQFGRDRLPEKLGEMADKGIRDKRTFYHHVYRNDAWRKGALGPKGKRWHSVYTCEDGGQVLRHSGYAEMPFFLPRWEVDTGHIWGRGPGFTALADARKLHLMTEANLRAAQRAADPTLLAPGTDIWTLEGQVRPGTVIYGGLDMAGRQMLRPLDTSSHLPLTDAMAQQVVEHIRDAFHWSLMTLAGRSGMSATEVIERSEEKLRMMAPNLGRVQNEYLGPKVGRRFQLLFRAGQIPPPPPEAAGAELMVHYTSAAAMAQRSAGGAAASRLLQDMAPLAQLRPEIMDRLDVDAYVELMQDARGASAKVLTSREDAERLRQARAQMQAAQMAMQAGAAMPAGAAA